jgi:hypothetical protein
MPEVDGGLSGLFSAPLVLPASVAGALAALVVVLGVVAWQRVPSRLLLPLAGLGLGILATLALVDLFSLGDRANTRSALLTREAELTQSALAPGSALACLDAGAGETVENACEKMVFASAQSVAAAVAYMGARLRLLATAADDGDDEVRAALASTRRAIERDRFGIAAQVLAIRDGCTANACAAFALVDDASALKANLRAQVFEQYVSRYAAGWTATASPSQQQPPAMSAVPPAPPGAAPVGAAPVAAIKPGEPWDYPSAASIPPVSIMNAEPPPKRSDAATQEPAEQPAAKNADVTAQTGPAAPAAKPAANAAPLPPTPPKRSYQQAPAPLPR